MFRTDETSSTIPTLPISSSSESLNIAATDSSTTPPSDEMEKQDIQIFASNRLKYSQFKTKKHKKKEF